MGRFPGISGKQGHLASPLTRCLCCRNIRNCVAEALISPQPRQFTKKDCQGALTVLFGELRYASEELLQLRLDFGCLAANNGPGLRLVEQRGDLRRVLLPDAAQPDRFVELGRVGS